MVGLTLILMQENDYVIAYCPALDLSSQGKTREEAVKAFDEACSLFLEESKRMGTLDQVLIDCGWRKEKSVAKSSSSKPRWSPPVVIGNIQEQVAIPV